MKKKEKGLSAIHLTMMALGCVIGGSFFLGSAVAINAAGPAIIISYILGGVLIYFILYALSELTVANPGSGSFFTFTVQAFGPGPGFVLGWVYWTGSALAMSSEATAVSILIREWFPRMSIPFLGSTIIIIVTLLNLLGATKLSKLESSLAAFKVLALISFIIVSLLLVIGFIPGIRRIGAGEITREPFMPGGIGSIAGSMLIVVTAYAGFEIIGLAASEAENPRVTVPKAIKYTVISLILFYILSVVAILPLIPTAELNEETSPMVAGLNRWGMGWAGTVLNIVLISAILSTLLATMFGLGRMIRSLAEEGQAPNILRDRTDVPYRGIIFSGFGMLAGLGIGLMLPRVYLFLVSSGGFAMLFTYAVILATHIRFRKKHGCPPEGRCQMPGYPYTSWIALISLIIILVSMPLIAGQTSGLIAGIIMIVLFSGIYLVMKFTHHVKNSDRIYQNNYRVKLSEEFSEELTPDHNGKDHSVDDNDCNCKK